METSKQDQRTFSLTNSKGKVQGEDSKLEQMVRKEIKVIQE